MNEKEIISQKIEFIKLEYQVLINRNENLLGMEWRVRQYSITLWLAAVGVGLGLQGTTSNNLYFLICSIFIPVIFLYMDARIGRWYYGHRARVAEIEKFMSEKEYEIPLTGKSVSFTDFSSSLEKTYHFPILDSSGRKTCKSIDYELLALNAFPHMKQGIRQYFYQFQIFFGLVLVSIQLYNMSGNPWSFALLIGSPLFYLALLIAVFLRRNSISRKFSDANKKSKEKKKSKKRG